LAAAGVAVVVFLAGSPGSADAQPQRWDSTEVVLPSRGLDSIRTEREGFARQRGDAEARAGTARLRIAEVEDQLEQIKVALTAADERIKAAKDQKAEADKVVAEAAKKRLERQRTVLERRRDLRTAEMDEARAESDYAEAATKALDIEYQLERRRQDGTDRPLLADLEKRTLEARVGWASKGEGLAGRKARTAERKASLFDAQQELLKATR
jgi:hypothetical protein